VSTQPRSQLGLFIGGETKDDGRSPAEGERLNGFARVVEVGIEGADLDLLLDVVSGRAIAVVVDVLVAGDVSCGAGITGRAALVLLLLDVQVAQHAHLHVLGGLYVAVVHVGAGLDDLTEGELGLLG
jgi:hypothetical protein